MPVVETEAPSIEVEGHYIEIMLPTVETEMVPTTSRPSDIRPQFSEPQTISIIDQQEPLVDPRLLRVEPPYLYILEPRIPLVDPEMTAEAPESTSKFQILIAVPNTAMDEMLWPIVEPVAPLSVTLFGLPTLEVDTSATSAMESPSPPPT